MTPLLIISCKFRYCNYLLLLPGWPNSHMVVADHNPQSGSAPAPTEKSHAWLRKIVPQKTLEEYENRYHLGNYVIDRKTGEKSFEAVRHPI